EQNAGSLITDGIDIVLRYSLPTDLGRFRLSFDGNYLIKQDVVLPSGKVLHSAGNYDLNVFSASLGVTPRLRFNTAVDYALGPFAASVGARYIGGFDECSPPSGTTAAGRGLCSDHNIDTTTGAPFPVHRVAAYTAVDLNAAYALKSSLGTTS